MTLLDLRIALFSGNYNYVRDGANQALNRLVGYLLHEGANVRVYAPTTAEPAFEPTGDLVSLPSLPFPGRGEYRFPLGLSCRIRRDLGRFQPNVVHVSSPDVSSHRAVSWARKRNLPVLASVHTRFETYPRYYGLAFLEPALVAMMRRFYSRCDAIVAPSESMAQVLKQDRMCTDVGIWSRGVDRTIFGSDRRDPQWRRSIEIADDEVVIGFVGRLVMEKGLDVFAETIGRLRSQGLPIKVLVIGEGPARGWLEEKMPGAIYTGFLSGAELGRAVACMDVLFNPSITETFGNVTLEAMACGVPVVAAAATGSTSLVVEGETGFLVPPGCASEFARVLERYVQQPQLRAAHGIAGELRSREFDWDLINGGLAETYLRLAHSRQGSS